MWWKNLKTTLKGLTMNTKVIDTDWNVVINLGTNCEVHSITNKLKLRYFSSPFDSIETTHGLDTLTELLSCKFEGFMNNSSDWKLYGRPKRTRNKKYEKLFYVHVYKKWLGDMKHSDWKNFNTLNSTWQVGNAWERFKTTMWNRQQRLISLLESENKVLFLRTDPLLGDDTKKSNVWNNNTSKQFENLIENVKKTYPNLNFGVYYLYSDEFKDEKRKGDFNSNDYIHYQKRPNQGKFLNFTENDWEVMKNTLKNIKLKPQEEMLPFDFEKTDFVNEK